MDKTPGNQSELLIYQTEDHQTRIQVLLENETVWLTQAQMSELFQSTKQNVSLHIQNIFEEGELMENSVVKNYLTTAADGKNYNTKHYNLDVVISVGYRVRSHRGTQFRMWATQRLREYIVKGFTLDDERLKEGPTRQDYFDELIERVREIRASEKNFYRKVTDIYATAIDYDPQSPMTHTFFATVQNKFHWAVTGQTAPEIIAERANSTKPNMGLTNFKGPRVKKSDIGTAKNYLNRAELRQLYLLVDQYLSFAELQAYQRKPMTMSDWVSKLDGFLQLNDREILEDAGRVSAQVGNELASEEFEKYKQVQRKYEAENPISDFDKAVQAIEEKRAKTNPNDQSI